MDKAIGLSAALTDLDLARLQWLFAQAFSLGSLNFDDNEEWAKGMMQAFAGARNLLAKASGCPGMKCCYCSEESYGMDHYFLHLVNHHSDERDIQGKLDGLIAATEERRVGSEC